MHFIDRKLYMTALEANDLKEVMTTTGPLLGLLSLFERPDVVPANLKLWFQYIPDFCLYVHFTEKQIEHLYPEQVEWDWYHYFGRPEHFNLNTFQRILVEHYSLVT